MAALFALIWLSRGVTDPVGLTVAKPFPAESGASRRRPPGKGGPSARVVRPLKC